MRRMRATALLAGVFGLLLLAACSSLDSSDDATATPEPTATPATLADALRALNYPQDLAEGRRLGDPDAPLHLEVFVDYRCPHCLGFTYSVEPTLIDEYVNDGKLLLEIRDYPVLGPASRAAAAAAVCATEQDHYWPYQKELFAAQAESRDFDHALFSELASDLGLDAQPFETCLDDPETTAAVDDDYAAAQALGLPGTPGLVINGEPLSGIPSTMDTWRSILNERLP